MARNERLNQDIDIRQLIFLTLDGSEGKMTKIKTLARSAVIIFCITSIFFALRLLTKSDDPRFCVTCHVMEEEYLSTVKGGLHNAIRCKECHLPQNNALFTYFYKSYFGIRDYLLFYSGQVPDLIQATRLTRNFVNSNCMRCHSRIVSRLDLSGIECLKCHRRSSHRMGPMHSE